MGKSNKQSRKDVLEDEGRTRKDIKRREAHRKGKKMANAFRAKNLDIEYLRRLEEEED